jgi:phosphoribosylanthranilate isomerase
VDAGADWIGFNFFPPSPRAISADTARSLSDRARAGPLRVGLFVDPTDDEVERVLAVIALDILQLYVAPIRAAALRARFGVPVWRAVGVAAPGDLPGIPEPIEAFVVESKPPPEATRPGGNAVAIDWTLTANWTPPLPWVLAGGLTPGNVADALATSGARAVDVSSGVERSRGVKDPALIRAFIARAKSVGAV